MKHLFCDIDNTVSNQYLRIKRHYNGKNMSKLLNDKELILQDYLIRDARKSLILLSKKYKINWLSARPKRLHKITEKWLTLKNLPIYSLTLVNSHNEKIKYLKKNVVDLYIDDMKYDYFKLDPKLMTSFISKIELINIKYEIFNNNWKFLLKKYV